MADLSTRTMTPSEFDAWQRQLARHYARSKVEAGTWTEDEALERALRSNAELLPHGLATPGMLLLTAVLGDGTPVGRLWVSLVHPNGAAGCAWIYDIEIDEAHRGQGYGRALLRAAEDAARSAGADGIELNVFGTNTVANGLYDSAGYTTTTRQMRKPLS